VHRTAKLGHTNPSESDKEKNPHFVDTQTCSTTSTSTNEENEFWIFGILDGHHMLGEYAAKIGSESLKKSFEKVESDSKKRKHPHTHTLDIHSHRINN
jgi:serine/threonine protein phosphatase PrpC